MEGDRWNIRMNRWKLLIAIENIMNVGYLHLHLIKLRISLLKILLYIVCIKEGLFLAFRVANIILVVVIFIDKVYCKVILLKHLIWDIGRLIINIILVIIK
jgi:hypothetical protein